VPKQKYNKIINKTTLKKKRQKGKQWKGSNRTDTRKKRKGRQRNTTNNKKKIIN
jgi:hypothetical protein